MNNVARKEIQLESSLGGWCVNTRVFVLNYKEISSILGSMCELGFNTPMNFDNFKVFGSINNNIRTIPKYKRPKFDQNLIKKSKFTVRLFT